MPAARSNRGKPTGRKRVVAIRPLRASIASDYSEARDLEDRILAAVRRRGYSNGNLFAIKLALEEALVNAIKHGNASDPGKKIHVQATVAAQEVEIVVEDEGPGFARGDVADPTRPENVDNCRGRGILLIESYMNEVEWSKGGRRLRMVRRNQEETLPKR